MSRTFFMIVKVAGHESVIWKTLTAEDVALMLGVSDPMEHKDWTPLLTGRADEWFACPVDPASAGMFLDVQDLAAGEMSDDGAIDATAHLITHRPL